MCEVVNLEEKLSAFSSFWDPKIVGELNGQHVRLVKFQGLFTWHSHNEGDELFLVLHGSFTMKFRNFSRTIREGEFIIVPRGTEHCPEASDEVHVLLFEPAGTLNTGTVQDDRTVKNPERI
ncbi:MAG TPA: cupin domain-containing protein [Thermoanaerobaculia bacterium]|nr:cupin domain-containing protein [Thermoanaerobaculia bacterium]HUM29238.1 cupin domain-containing protein [Thermoanaerobaculia bacterium]HXK67803.1 cupin domain-containing protein [Thermoanaerobaculia bacterium]